MSTTVPPCSGCITRRVVPGGSWTWSVRWSGVIPVARTSARVTESDRPQMLTNVLLTGQLIQPIPDVGNQSVSGDDSLSGNQVMLCCRSGQAF